MLEHLPDLRRLLHDELGLNPSSALARLHLPGEAEIGRSPRLRCLPLIL